MTRHFLSVWQPCRATSLFDQSVSLPGEDGQRNGVQIQQTLQIEDDTESEEVCIIDER